MSRKMFLATLALALSGIFFASSAFAADAPQQTRLVGKLTTISGKTLTITGESGSAVTVTCNDATKYRRDETNSFVSFTDLKTGQTIRVYYGSDKVATLVNIAKPNSK